MTPEEMRIAIHEKLGWEWHGDPLWVKTLPYWKKGNEAYRYPEDYCNDLNAMAEAESILTAEQQIRYGELIELLTGSRRHWLHVRFDLLHATAAQRCEAFCRLFWPERFKA